MMVIKGSRLLLQSTNIPPWALFEVIARSLSYKSSELRLEQYSELKIVVAVARSDWKSHGSEMKRRSIYLVVQILWRSMETLLKPSQLNVQILLAQKMRACLRQFRP